jgi:predicted small secreted protein
LTISGRVFIAQSVKFGEIDMRTLIVMAAAAAALWVAGCNTVAGLGQDVAAAGHAVASTAEDAKR